MIHEITFAPTLRCNFRCQHCAIALEDKATDELSLSEIEMMLDSDIASNADFYITGGEPYCRQDVDAIIGLVLQHTSGLVKVLTNGYLTDRYVKTAQRFANARDRLRFSISLDGAIDQHNLIRNNGKSFQRAMESIRLLASAGYDVHACCIAQSANLHSIPEFRTFMQAEGIQLTLSPLMEYGDSSIFRDNYETEAEILWKNLNATPANYSYVMSRGEMRIKDCHAGIDSLYISPYGEVSECFVKKDFLPQLGGGCDGIIGNIRTHGPSLDDVYQRFEPEKRSSAHCPGCTNESEVIRESLNHDLMIPFLPGEYERLEGPIPGSIKCGDKHYDRLLISGWSYAEGTHRWMQRVAHAHVRGDGKYLHFTVLCDHYDLEMKDVELDLYINGRMLSTISFHYAEKGKFIDHTICLPTDIVGRKIHDVKFVVDRTWESRVSGTRRRHGLAFGVIELLNEASGRV